MENTSEIKNIKTESSKLVSSGDQKIPSKIELDKVKQEGDYFFHSELDMKSEESDVEYGYTVVASTSFDMYPCDDIKFKTKETMIQSSTAISVDEFGTPIETQIYPVKEVNMYSIHTELRREDENEFPNITGLSYKMCSSYDIKYETDKPIVKMEFEDLEKKVYGTIQDPLDVGDEIKGNPYEICRNDGFKVKSDEPIFKIEYEDQKQDLIEVNSEIKVEKQFSSYLDQGESRIKTELIEEQKDENLVETEKDDSYSSKTNQGQDQLLIRNDSGGKGKKYVCRECKKAFTLKHNFNHHSRMHTGKKLYKCGVCEKIFNKKCNLDTHMLIHSGKKPHSCDLCKKVYSRKAHLDSHKMVHSGAKPFSCTECNKSFARKDVLERHKRIHTNYKPYSCDSCDKAFTDQSAFVRHRRLHTGQKPYSCDICNKSFADKSYLNQHKKIHRN